jgi:AraC-like DNA-binding protein
MKLLPSSPFDGGQSQEEHPVRRAMADCLGNQALRPIVSKAMAERRFLSDSELREVENEIAGVNVRKEEAQIRRETARLLREYSISFVEAVGKPVRTAILLFWPFHCCLRQHLLFAINHNARHSFPDS